MKTYLNYNFSTLLLFLTVSSASILPGQFEMKGNNSVVELEKYVAFENLKTYSPVTCDLIVLSTGTRNVISFAHPLIIISPKVSLHSLKLKSMCNIINIFIPSTNSEEYLMELRPFLYVNFVSIPLIVIFLEKFQRASDYKFFSKTIHKDTVVVDAQTVTNFRHGLTFCDLVNPKCFLMNRCVRVGYNEMKPYFGLTKSFDELPEFNITPHNLDSILDDYAGVEFEILKLYVYKYKMSFQLTPSIFGEELPNGSWTGKLGLLATNKVHMILGILPGNYRRGKIGAYSTPIFMTRFTLVSRRPGLLPSYQAPLRPFPLTAWLALLVSIIVIGPFTYWISKMHWTLETRVKKQPKHKKFNTTIGKVCSHIALTLISEPWLLFKPNGPSVFILSGWFLACMALQCFYSSNLIACFSIPETQRAVTTLEDVKELGKTIFLKNGSTPSLFLGEGYTKANVRFVNASVAFGPDALIYLEDFNVVSARDVNIFKFRVMRSGKDWRDYYISPKPFLNVFSGWLYAHLFELKEPMNIILLRAAASGLIEFWLKTQFRNGSITNQMAITISLRDENAERARKSKDEPLTMHHVQVLFYLWAGGLALGGIAFAFELSCSKIYQRM